MKHQTAQQPDALTIVASETSAAADFDFLLGRWNIHNRKLKRRLAGSDEWTEFAAAGECRRVLHGCGNIDSFTADFDGEAFEGLTLRLFNPQTRLWSIYWADSRAVALDVPQVGSFAGGCGEFLARDTFEGRPIVVKFRWDARAAENPVWSQAFSDDDGATWEWNWFMRFSRRA